MKQEQKQEQRQQQEHTPGPWSIQGGTNKAGDLYIWMNGDYAGGHAVATVHGEIQDNTLANAHLIAAAPDLLDACKAVVDPKINSSTGTRITGYEKAAVLCRAAIAKAETS